jgi:hypothetical protein
MANVLTSKSYFVEQIVRETLSKDGGAYVKYAYLNNSGGEIIKDDISQLSNKVQTLPNTQVIGDKKLAVVIQETLQLETTFDRIYFCNSNDNILEVLDISEKTALVVNDEFIINLDEESSVVV